MPIMRIRLVVVPFLILMLGLSGCGSSVDMNVDEVEVSAIVDQFAENYRTKNSAAMQELFASQVTLVDKNLGTEQILSDDQIGLMFAVSFSLMETVHDVSVGNKQVTISGSQASVSFDLVLDVTTFGFRNTTSESVTFQLAKQSGNWKIVRYEYAVQE